MTTKILSESQRSDSSFYSSLGEHREYDQEIYHEIDELPSGVCTGATGKSVDNELGQSKSSERYSMFPTDNKNANGADDNQDYLSPTTITSENASDYLELKSGGTPRVKKRSDGDYAHLQASLENRTPSGFPEPDYQ